VIQNHDHIKKNYYLYRNPDETDDRWTIFPWDLELTFGHLWTEEMDVLDEQLFTDEPLEFGVCPGFCNQLLTRLYEVPGYQDRFYEMVGHIIETSFNADFIDELIDNALCRATPDLLADSMKRATNDEYLDRVDELRAFVQARRTYILEL
jgi:spore coat protein CotH